MSSIKKEIIELTRETLESSSIHAIPNISKNKYYLIKFMWLVCFLVSSGVCSWFITNSITDYLNYDIVSQINIKYQNQLIFPIISICNLNFVSNSSMNYLIESISGEKPDERISSWPKLILNYGKYFNYSTFDRRDFGRTLDQMIINCYFGAQLCNLTNDFEYFYDINYGNCFRYNSGKDMNNHSTTFKHVNQNGLYNALILDLYTGRAIDNNNFFAYENGYIIFINNQSLDSTFREGVQVSSGLSTRIVLNKFTINKPQKPYTECTSDLTSIDAYDSDTYKRTFSPDKVYKYSDCSKVCLQKLFADKCECQSKFYDFTYNKTMRKCSVEPYINVSVDLKCESENGLLYYNNTKFIEDCDCPIECEITGYTYTTSVAEFPTLKYHEYLKDKMISKSIIPNMTYDYQYIKDSVARVYVYYDEMKQTEIKNDIKTQLSDLVSNIGGTLGLFLAYKGLSFLSLIELAEIIMQVILVIIHGKNSKLTKINQNLAK